MGNAQEIKTQDNVGFGTALERLDLDWSDEGEIQVRETGIPTETGAKAAEDLKVAEDAKPAAEEKPLEDQKPPEDSPEIADLKAKIAKLESQITAGEKPPGITENKPLEFSTPESFVPEDKDIVDMISGSREDGIKFLKNFFDAHFNPFIDAMRPMIIKDRIREEAAELFQTHGADFGARIPIIKTLVQKRPDLSLRAAYDLVKEIPLPAATKAKTENQVEASDGSPGVASQDAITAVAEAKAIAERAEKLQTEKGVAASGEKTEPTKITVKDALNKTLEDLNFD